MNITVIGASGKTGQELVKQALAAGHFVTALVRNPDKLKDQANLTVIIGDVTISQDIVRASKDAHVIVSALGAMGGTLMTDSVNAVVAASKVTGVTRFILMSSFAVRKDQLSGGTKLMTSLIMSKAVKDKGASEDILRSSDLDWTIVYATGLTNDKRRQDVRVVAANEKISMNNKISRADVAAWIINEAQSNTLIKKEVLITT